MSLFQELKRRNVFRVGVAYVLIAWVLLHVDLPALLKYPILALATYVASNLLVCAYTKAVERLTAKPFTSHAPSGWRGISGDAGGWGRMSQEGDSPHGRPHTGSVSD